MIIDSHVHLPALKEGKNLADAKEELLQEFKKNNIDHAHTNTGQYPNLGNRKP